MPLRKRYLLAAAVLGALPLGSFGEPTNDQCDTAVALNANIIASGDNTGAVGAGASSCSTGDTLAVWYSLAAKAGSSHTVVVQPSPKDPIAMDATVEVWDSCGRGGAVAACSDAGASGAAETVNFTNSSASDATFYIRVAGYQGATGPFTIIADPVDPGDTLQCPSGNVDSIAPVTGANAAFVGSDDLLGTQEFEHVSVTSSTITGLRWWGYGDAGFGSDCDLSEYSFRVGFYHDNAQSPGAVISEQLVMPTIRDTGQLYLGMLSLRVFEATLPTPVYVPAGGAWLSIYVPNAYTGCQFAWNIGSGQDNLHTEYSFTNLSYTTQANDLSYCLLGHAGEGEGEGEGQTDPLSCAAGNLESTAPETGTGENIFHSGEIDGVKVFDRLTISDSTVTGLRWWGTATGTTGGGCDPSSLFYRVGIFADAGGSPGAAISLQTVTPTITYTGQLYGAQIPLYLFEATLPKPVYVQTGGCWLGIYTLLPANDCHFSWDGGDSDDNLHYAYDIASAAYSSVADDLAFCLVGVAGGGEGEGEGEGQADPLACPTGTLESTTAELGNSASFYASNENAANRLFEHLTSTSGTVTGVRWWGGSFAGLSTDCEPAALSFKVGIYADNAGLPGAVIHEETLTPAYASTGQYIDVQVPLRVFDATFATPVSLPAGGAWLSIYVAASVNGCHFYWDAGDGQDAQHVVYDLGRSQYSTAANDLAFCLEGTPGAGEGEGEGEGEGQVVFETADQDHNNAISLSELLRVIQFYNSLGLHCADQPGDTEDGFVPGPGANETCAAYGCDYNPQDWVISLSELLRMIQFYNSLGYHYCPGQGTEDGFCPGLV